ncbi:hypothetical protein B0H13DRAFT_1897577 [Mycena leptocephala]|nr:hypothetical protein B0H13DRAFT_1897577 [Mycena leptocephala]
MPPLTPLQNLAAPPADFFPCSIPMHLGANFTDHVDFSGKGNKRYWVLHLGPGQGVYTLKEDCVAAAGRYARTLEAYEAVDRWQLVVPHWGKHCFHRHGKCASHRNACMNGQCPTHPPAANPGIVRVPRQVKVENNAPSSIKRERYSSVKLEPNVQVKRELQPHTVPRSPSRTPADSLSRAALFTVAPSREATPLVGPPSRKNLAIRAQRAAEKGDRARRPPPPRYTPVEETESEGECVGRQPLFDPDSSEDERSAPPLRISTLNERLTTPEQDRSQRAPAPVTPPSPTPSHQPMRSRRIEESAPSHKLQQRDVALAAAPLSAGVSSISSLSMSSVSSSVPSMPAKRGVMGTASSISSIHRGDDPSAHVDDPFYVGSSGAIHHSSSRAFEDVTSGPVRVVMGWEEATRVALEVVSSAKGAVDRKGKGKARRHSMDLD